MKIFLFQCLWLNCYCDGFSRYIEGGCCTSMAFYAILLILKMLCSDLEVCTY